MTIGADKGYDTEGFVATLRSLNATLHVAQNDTNRRSAVDGRTTHHPGYQISGKVRKLIEDVFGWIKTVSVFPLTCANMAAKFVPTSGRFHILTHELLGNL